MLVATGFSARTHLPIRFWVCRGIALALLASVASGSANAQQKAGQERSSLEPGATLEEIIVTTSRLRPESLRRAGLTVTAFSGDELVKRGIDDFSGIAQRTPGLDFSDRGPNKNNISIRGLSNSILATNFQRNNALVALYLDDVSVVTAFSTQREFNLYDLERVEVVKGPQGTLYGEGAMGGAIRYSTANPNMVEFGANARATLSQTKSADDLNTRIDAMVNLPIIGDVFAIRLTAYSQQDAGFIDFTGAQPVPGAVLDGVPKKDANSGDSHGVRLVALAEPSEQFTSRLMLNYEDAHSDTEWVVSVDPERLENARHFTLEPQDDEVLVGSLRFDYKTEDGTWTAVTGYVDRQRLDAGFDPGYTNSFNLPGTKVFDIQEESLSQEIRFASHPEGRIRFLVGGYFKDTDTTVDLVISSALPSAPGRALDEDESYKATHYAFFGEVNFDFTERLTASIGARYFNENVDSVQIWNEADPGTILAGIPTTRVDDAIAIDKVLPKLSVEFRATDGLLWYGNVAKGARNGGLSFTSSVTISNAFGFPVDNAYDEDSAWSYELGVKSQWLDRRLTVDAALYYLDWSNVQAEFYTEPFGFQIIGNAGAASSKGVELGLAYEATEHVGLRLGSSWIDAQFDDAYVANIVTGATVPEGTRIPFTPEWTVAGALDLRWPLGATKFIGTIEYFFTGQQAGQALTVPAANPSVPFYEIDAQDIWNVRAAIRGNRWGVTLFANNVLDENVAQFRAVSNIYPQAGNYYVNRPRTVGLTIDYDF